MYSMDGAPSEWVDPIDEKSSAQAEGARQRHLLLERCPDGVPSVGCTPKPVSQSELEVRAKPIHHNRKPTTHGFQGVFPTSLPSKLLTPDPSLNGCIIQQGMDVVVACPVCEASHANFIVPSP